MDYLFWSVLHLCMISIICIFIHIVQNLKNWTFSFVPAKWKETNITTNKNGNRKKYDKQWTANKHLNPILDLQLLSFRLIVLNVYINLYAWFLIQTVIQYIHDVVLIFIISMSRRNVTKMIKVLFEKIERESYNCVNSVKRVCAQVSIFWLSALYFFFIKKLNSRQRLNRFTLNDKLVFAIVARNYFNFFIAEPTFMSSCIHSKLQAYLMMVRHDDDAKKRRKKMHPQNYRWRLVILTLSLSIEGLWI